MPTFRAPTINLYSRDLPRAVAFYSAVGFVETFRTPASSEPAHIELNLDGFNLGIAKIEAAKEHHGLRPEGEGRWIEIVLWSDDTDAAVSALIAKQYVIDFRLPPNSKAVGWIDRSLRPIQ